MTSLTATPVGFASELPYQEKFTQPIQSILKQHGYWVFCDEAPDPKKVDNQGVKRRLITTPQGLKVIKFAQDKDFTNTNLNPRTELRLEGLRQKVDNKDYELTFSFTSVSKSLVANVFQIMSRTLKGEAKPIVQIEVRDGFVCIRQSQFDDINTLIRTKTKIQATIGKQLNFKILYKPSVEKGVLEIFCDKEVIHAISSLANPTKGKTNKTAWKAGEWWWLQSGIYGNRGVYSEIVIHEIGISLLPVEKPPLALAGETGRERERTVEKPIEKPIEKPVEKPETNEVKTINIDPTKYSQIVICFDRK